LYHGYLKFVENPKDVIGLERRKPAYKKTWDIRLDLGARFRGM